MPLSHPHHVVQFDLLDESVVELVRLLNELLVLSLTIDVFADLALELGEETQNRTDGVLGRTVAEVLELLGEVPVLLDDLGLKLRQPCFW